MAADRKDRDDGLKGLFEDDESAWDDAIDAWDKAFAVPEGATQAPAPAPAKTTPAPPPAEPRPEATDPFVEFIVGEMDLPDEGGEALGSLLGSAVVEEPTPVRTVKVGETARREPVAPTVAAEARVERAPARAVPPTVHEEPTPVRARPAAPSLPATEEPSAEIDLGSLLDQIASDGLGTPAAPVPEPAPPSAPAPEPPAPAVAAPAPVVESPAPPSLPPPPSLDLFDEILRPAEPEEEVPIEAGEVLPLPAPPREEPRHTLPSTLDAAELSEPPLPPPAVPAHLQELALESWTVPEQVTPLAESRSYWERLSERFQLEASLTDSSARGVDYELTVAHAFEELGEDREAINHYREALNHRASHAPAKRELLRLLASTGDHAEVAALLGELAELVGPDERRALNLTRAELLWSRAGDDAGARILLDEITERGARDLRTLLIRADLASAGGDEEELGEVLSVLAEAVSDAPVEAAIWVELGRIHEGNGRSEAALAAYQRATAAAPTCLVAHEGVLRITSGSQDRAAQVRALEKSGIDTGLWGARRLRRRARLSILQSGKPTPRALEVLVQAAELVPEDPLVLDDLAWARSRAGDSAGALDTLTALASVTTSPVSKALTLAEAARLAEDALGDRARARSLLDQARGVAPRLDWIRELGSALLRGDPDPERRIEAVRAAASEARGTTRALLHFAAAEAQLELGRDGDAAVELVACLEHAPSFPPALSRLERVYRGTGQHDRLAAALDTAAEVAADPITAGDYRERAAFLYEGRLAKPDLALRRYRQLRESFPDSLPARLGVLRNLVTLGHNEDLADELALVAPTASSTRAASSWIQCGAALSASGRGEEGAATYRMAADKAPDQPQAIWPLAIWLASRKKWGELNERWSALCAALDGAPQQKLYQLRLAAIAEATNDLDEAARWYAEAASGTRPVLGARECMARIARRTRDWDAQIRDLRAELERAATSEARLALRLMLADLARRSGAERSEQERQLRAVLEEAPGQPLARCSLESLLVATQAWQPLADLLLGDIREGAGNEVRIAAYRALADLDLRRGDEEGARLSLGSIVDLDAKDLSALRMLSRAAAVAGRDQDLVTLLEREARASDARDAAALWLELARRMAARPAEPSIRDQHKAALLAVLEHDPACLLALRSLVDGAWNAGEREELCRYFHLLARALRGGRDAAIYLTRAAELSGAQADAVTFYREALEQQSDYLGAIYRLRDLALRIGDWSSAAAAAEAEGRASRVRAHVGEAYLLAGEIARQKLADTPRAMQAYRCVLEANPLDRIAFDALRDHYEKSQDWSELCKLLEARTTVERSRVKLVELHQALATIASERLHDRGRAKQELRRVLELRPEEIDALAMLADLCTEDQEWPEAADALLRVARLEKNPIQLRDLFLRLGVIYHDHTPDPKRAIACFNRVVTLDSGHLEALQRLSDLYLASWDYKRALSTTTQLFEKEPDRARRIEHMLRIARIHEDGFKDAHQAAIAFRQALELSPTDLKSIGELCGFFARQSDQRSLMVHLDRSVAAMRARLRHDPFEAFAYQALFKIFGWRKAPDGCLCTAQVLDAIGEIGAEEREFLDSHLAAVGSPGNALCDPEHDEWMFHRSIPGGFRQVFQMLAEPFVREFGGNLRDHGVTRSDRIQDADHPLRRTGDAIARDVGVSTYDLYLARSNPALLVVENTSPPSILVGSALIEGSTEEELQFIMGRCLWMIRKSMILPSRLLPADLEILVAGVVRQYAPDFQPVEADLRMIQDATRRVAKTIPRKLRQELMPFALECSGQNVDLRSLGGAVVHTANRAGLLASRSIHAALSVLRRIAGRQAPRSTSERVRSLRGNTEAEELIQFTVSDSHFELRRTMGVAVR